MEEDEIWDTVNIPQKTKNNIWITRLVTILIIALAFLFPKIIHVFFPYYYSNIVFGVLSFSLFINTIGFIFFLKNIDYQSTKVVNILIQSICLVFLGVVLSSLLYNLSIPLLPDLAIVYLFYVDFSFQKFLDMISISLILGLTIPVGIYYWLDKNNRWLLPFITLILLFLIYMYAKM